MKKLALIIFLGCILFCQAIKAQCPERTNEEWKEYFKERINNLDPIEGLWNCKIHSIQKFDDGSPDYILDNQKNYIIVKLNDYFFQCYFDRTGKTEPNITYGTDGSQAYHKVTYEKTAVNGVYLYNSYLKFTDGTLIPHSSAFATRML